MSHLGYLPIDRSSDRSGSFRKLLHLARNHGKAAPGFTGSGRFDRRIKCKQVGLSGNAVDLVDQRLQLPGFIDQLMQLSKFFAGTRQLRFKVIANFLLDHFQFPVTLCHELHLMSNFGNAGHLLLRRGMNAAQVFDHAHDIAFSTCQQPLQTTTDILQ